MRGLTCLNSPKWTSTSLRSRDKVHTMMRPPTGFATGLEACIFEAAQPICNQQENHLHQGSDFAQIIIVSMSEKGLRYNRFNIAFCFSHSDVNHRSVLWARPKDFMRQCRSWFLSLLIKGVMRYNVVLLPGSSGGCCWRLGQSSPGLRLEGPPPASRFLPIINAGFFLPWPRPFPDLTQEAFLTQNTIVPRAYSKVLFVPYSGLILNYSDVRIRKLFYGWINLN